MNQSTKFLIVASLVASMLSIGCEGRVNLQGRSGDTPFETTEPGVDSDDDGVHDDQEPPPGTIVRPDEDDTMDPDAEDVCKFIDPGSTPLRRLTEDEYNNSVRDLFAGVQIPRQTFAPDERVSGFEANVLAPVSELMAEEYQRAAEAISETVLGTDLLPNTEPAAVRSFVTDLATRAYRRPATPEEVDALVALYDAGATEFDGETGAQMVVEAVLQSPNFLYRSEVGIDSDEPVVQLTNYEVASRLSYFLWGSIPDEELLTAAAEGKLTTASEIETQARRMLASPKARDRVNTVMAQWLRVDAIENTDHGDEAFTDEMRSSMMAETQAFIDEVIWEDGGSVNTLLTANYTFVDSNIASLYGLEATADEGLVRVELPDNRLGLLSQPGVLSANGHGQYSVHRGKFIREALLCTPPYSPPDVLEELPTFDGESMRSKAEKRMNATDEGCAGCHSQYDGIGLAFDNFDELGRYRTEDEHGNALTAGGVITATGEIDGDIDGVEELATTLAGSDAVKTCVAKQFFRYATARNEGSGDACSMHVIQTALDASGGDIKEMLVALTKTDAFRYRKNLDPSM